MPRIKTSNPGRRDFLRLGWALGAGLVVPAVGCSDGGSGDDSNAPLPGETFVEPTALASVDGRLDVTLTLAYANLTLDGKSVTLRSMNGSVPAPTLRVNAGDRLRIKVVNELPPNPGSSLGPVAPALFQQHEPAYAWTARHAGTRLGRASMATM